MADACFKPEPTSKGRLALVNDLEQLLGRCRCLRFKCFSNFFTFLSENFPFRIGEFVDFDAVALEVLNELSLKLPHTGSARLRIRLARAKQAFCSSGSSVSKNFLL